MKPVVVKNCRIGEGKPKIVVPIVGITEQEVLEQAAAIRALPVDVVEWRADWFSGSIPETAEKLRAALGGLPLLFTFRTRQEGGEREITPDLYARMLKGMAESGLADLIDLELFFFGPEGEGAFQNIVENCHKYGVKVVASNHDFHKTPPKEEIVARLRRMQELGADIPKIAVMPQCKKDVLTLLAATEEMASEYADRPIITMSMGGLGVISRLVGESMGSAMTFGAAGKASAPGQIGVKELAQALEIVHNGL